MKHDEIAFENMCEKFIEENKEYVMAFSFNDFTFRKKDFEHSKFWPTEFTVYSIEGINGAVYVSI